MPIPFSTTFGTLALKLTARGGPATMVAVRPVGCGGASTTKVWEETAVPAGLNTRSDAVNVPPAG
jgi:hypothetical protein